MTRRRFVLLSAAVLPAHGLAADGGAAALAKEFEKIRKARGVPALTGGIITTDGLQSHAATGVRKAGGSTPVSASDLWHLGSMTKALTATLLGTFVMEGRLKWDATLGELLPDLMKQATPQFPRITVRHLLNHRSGLPADREAWGALPASGNRPEIVRLECKKPLLSEPGGAYLYSNLGYMIAGVVAERLGRGIWERVIMERLFRPLHLAAGFGGLGTLGKEDQPWPHGADGKPMPENGLKMDNPPALGPAGTCHMALADYAKFVADHLRGAAGMKALLPASLYHDLHTPPSGTDYAFGWRTAERDWGGGTVLTHNGTNTMNYAVVWMAPARRFAVAAFCNQGGDSAAKACDDVCTRLLAFREPGN